MSGNLRSGRPVTPGGYGARAIGVSAVSYACSRERHSNCTKVSCPCECHGEKKSALIDKANPRIKPDGCSLTLPKG